MYVQAGLPPASKNAATWPLKRSMLQQAGLAATPELIHETKGFMQAVLRLRYSTKLLRLTSADSVQQQVHFALSDSRPCNNTWHALSNASSTRSIFIGTRMMQVCL